MAYVHNGRRVVNLTNDPIGQYDTDWVYFSYQDWLREYETITSHAATVSGGTIVTDSTDVGSVVDNLGDTYTNCYGVELSVTSGSTKVTVIHRVTSTVTGSPDLGRTSIDRTITIPVRSL
jgi:hypothetical protein